MKRQVNIVAVIAVALLLSLFNVHFVQGIDISRKAVVFSNFKNYNVIKNKQFIEDKYAYCIPSEKFLPFIRYYFPERVKVNQITIYAVKNYTPKKVKLKYGNKPYALKTLYDKIILKYKKYKGNIYYTKINIDSPPEANYYWLEFPVKNEIRITEIAIDTNQAEIEKKVFNVKIIDITDTTVTISWESNYYGVQTILVGRNPEELYAQKLGGAGIKHIQTIEYLLPGTTYYYAIGMMGDTRGVFFSDVDSFVTTGLTPPEITHIRIEPEKYKITVHFKTNIPVRPYADVYEGETLILSRYPVSKVFAKDFVYNVANLLPNTLYYFQFYLIDQHKQVVRSRRYKVRTKENNIALGKKVYSTFKKTEYLVDGDNSALSSLAKSDTLKKDNYVMIDFGEEIEFDKLLIQWRALAYPLKYYVMIGDNVLQFPYVKEVEVPDTLPTKRSRTGDPMKEVITDIRGAKGRFLKVLIKKGAPNYRKHKRRDWLEILEVKVYKIEHRR